jgi:hypothetical protein
MQKREFKDVMKELIENVGAKITEHSDHLVQLNKNTDDDLLKMGRVGMDLDHPRTVLYAILHKVLDDFKPRNDKYESTMDEVFRQLGIIHSVEDEPKRPEKKKTQRTSKDRIAKAKKPEANKTGIKGAQE